MTTECIKCKSREAFDEIMRKRKREQNPQFIDKHMPYVRVIQVIETDFLTGTGKDDCDGKPDPMRRIRTYTNFDGKLLAYFDPTKNEWSEEE